MREHCRKYKRTIITEVSAQQIKNVTPQNKAKVANPIPAPQHHPALPSATTILNAQTLVSKNEGKTVETGLDPHLIYRCKI